MTRTIKYIVVLKVTYLINAIFYYLKTIPLIKRILPYTLLSNKPLKIVLGIISNIVLLLKSISFKFSYLYVAFMIPLLSMDKFSIANMFHVLIFMTFIGGMGNTKFFEISTHRYYGIVLLKINAKKYYIADYLYYIFELFFGYAVTFLGIYFLLWSKMPQQFQFITINEVLACSIVFPLFTVTVKNIFIAVKIYLYEKRGDIPVNYKYQWISVAIFLPIAYGLPYMGFTVPPVGFAIVMAIAFVINIFAIRKIVKFCDYYYITRAIQSSGMNAAVTFSSSNKSDVIKKTFSKKIDADVTETSRKNGFDYFNDLFVKRHKKVLTKMSNRIALILGVLFVAASYFVVTDSKIAVVVSAFMSTSLPVLLFIMYFINRGQSTTATMFMNCDSSMLCYNFYKKPSTVLAVFTRRLKSLVVINLIPSAVIAVGLPLLLFLSGADTQIYMYILIFVTVISMSVFFSVHYLVLYYLLQPYNASLKLKNPLYSVISVLTYLGCYTLINVQIPMLYFCIAVIAFTCIYVLVSLVLAYKLAPRTFKIK